MGTPVVIGLGILAWVLLAILGALFVARMIRLRDGPRPDRTEPGAPAEAESADGAESFHMQPGWHLPGPHLHSEADPIWPGRQWVADQRRGQR